MVDMTIVTGGPFAWSMSTCMEDINPIHIWKDWCTCLRFVLICRGFTSCKLQPTLSAKLLGSPMVLHMSIQSKSSTSAFAYVCELQSCLKGRDILSLPKKAISKL
jgi:hypothetical protein